MKNVTKLFFLILFCFPVFLNAQSETKVYFNEVGTDVVVLLERLFKNTSGENYNPYQPFYQLTYKMNFKMFNARFGIGGNTSFRNSEDEENGREYDLEIQEINYRIGIERKEDMGRWWNFYYGVDFKNSIYKIKRDRSYSSGGWQVGYVSNSNLLGISPLFGLEFKINNRLSLQTEASFLIYNHKESNYRTAVPIVDNPSGSMPSRDPLNENEYGVNFNVPDFLILAIKF